jgi:hypothetical protein
MFAVAIEGPGAPLSIIITIFFRAASKSGNDVGVSSAVLTLASTSGETF